MLIEQLKVEFRTYLREPIYLVFSIIMPVLSFAMIGGIYGNQSYNGIDFFSQFIPGLCVLVLFSSTIYNVANQVISDKERGIYKRLAVTPVSIFRIMFVVVLKAFIISFTGFALIIALAKFVFHAEFHSIGIFLTVFTLVIMINLLIGFGLGILFNKLNVFASVMMPLFFPMFMLSDSSFPLESMPKFLQKMALFNPLYHLNIILRVCWDINNYSIFRTRFLISLGSLFSIITIFFLYVTKVYKTKKYLENN